MTDLKYWITEESWRMDVVWKKFTLVRPFSREISLKFAVETSFHGYGYKGWKISFRLHSIQRSLLHALYTHRKRSNKDTSNGSGYETRPAPKGMIAKLSFFLSIEKNINIPGIRFQKSFVRPKNTSFKPIHNIPWN